MDFDLNENNILCQVLFEEIPSDDNSSKSCNDSEINASCYPSKNRTKIAETSSDTS